MTEEKLPDQNPPPWIKDYKPKREWVGLTDEDIKDCESWCGDQHDFAYEIEAKLKEKNT